MSGWEDIEADITEEFSSLTGYQSLETQAKKAVHREIHYRIWSAKENKRFSPVLRRQLESLAKSQARISWLKQKETEKGAEKKTETVQDKKQPKKRKPRVAPAPTRSQQSYQKRKAMREKLPDERRGLTHH